MKDNDSNEIQTLDEVTIQHILKVLEHTNYNISKTARYLNVTRVTVYNWLKKERLKVIRQVV